MGESYKEHDPEKGPLSEDAPRPSIGEGISNIFSKAGEGIASAITKAGEGIQATGTTLKDGAKSAGGGITSAITKAGEGIHATGTVLKDGAKVVGLGGPKTPQKQKKNPQRAKHEKKFHKNFKPIPHEEPKDTNIVGNITKLLPANTFLMFQTLAPLATNDGHCGHPEVIMTSVMLIILASTCMLVCFTDTIQFNGKVYHGLVTRKGLWNPSFKGDPSFVDLRLYELKLAQFYEARRRYKSVKREARKEGIPLPDRPEEPLKPVGPYVMGSTFSSGNSQYQLNFTDFLHAVLSAMAFATLTMLTNPVSTCFYPNIPSTVVKTLPLLVGFVISAIFAFSPPARNGIAHPLSPKVPSQMDNYKPPDPKGMVHGPQLPPKPPGGKGDHGHVNPKPDDDDDDDLGDSVKKYLKGKFFGSSDQDKGKSGSPTEHHLLQDGVKALASGFLSKYGDDIKRGSEKIGHSLEDEAKKEVNQLLLKAAPAVTELSKDIHIPLALQEAAKSVPHEALVAGLVKAGAHPALAVAAVQSAVQDAKDAALTQIHQELQAATSGPLAGLSRQSSIALTRANSTLQSRGSSLSLPSGPDALFHQAAQVLQRQVSGLPPNVHAAGSEAAAIALATGQALMQAGYPLSGSSQSPQATALNAFAHNIGNQLNLNSANELIKDANSLVQQGNKSLAEVHEELARQGVTLNSQMQALYLPGSSVAHSTVAMANSGSQALSQGTLAATLAAGAAQEAGTLLLEGADQGMAGVHAEIARRKGAVAQTLTSLAHDTVSRGSQSLSDAKAELLKQKEVLTLEMYSQARALSTPANSVAQDLNSLVTTQVGSQPTMSAVNSQFVESLALGVAQGMAQAGSQPAASIAIDIASLLQPGSQMHAQLARQASALSPEMQAAATMMQRQVSFGKLQQPSVADTHMALRHLASQLSPQQGSPEFSQWMSTLPSNRPNNASLTIEEVTAAAAAGQRGLDRVQRGVSQLPRVTEEIVTQAAAQMPTASQVQTMSSEIVTSTSEVARQVALANMTHILRLDRPESTEIIDAISIEEITNESELELNNRGHF